MKKLFLLFFLALAFSADSFSQDNQTQSRPQAYLVSRGDTTPQKPRPKAYIVKNISDKRPPQAYLLSSGDTRSATTRPRVYKATQTNLVKAANPFELERSTFDLINRYRENSGLLPLKWSDDVAKIARLHSENMANFNFFSHTGLDGSMVNDRADLLGISKWRAIGENIAFNQGYDNPVEFAVARWMESPAHRENLLNSRWRESGIGVAVTKEGKYYFTEVFMLK